jgi:dihydrofolate reductase
MTASTPEQARALARNEQEAFIIGGAELFAQTIALADRMIVTEIAGQFACDTFFPEVDAASWRETGRESLHSAASGLDFAIVTYDRVR